MASTAQSLPYFGRAWQISVDTADGTHLVLSSDQFSEALRVTFAIDMFLLLDYWQAQVTIYNLSSETAGQIAQGAPNLGQLWQSRQPLVAGDTVTVSAGYQSSSSGSFDAGTNVIYSGKLLQPVWLRENVVDFKLILRCVTGLLEDAVNFTGFTLAKGATDLDTLGQVCSQAERPIQIENIDAASRAKLAQTVYPRAQAFHGRPWNYIRQIAAQNNLFAWVSPNGLNVRSFDPSAAPAAPDYAYGPPDLPGSYTTGGTAQGLVKKTLLGSPAQTQDGVLFRVLLDPQVRIGDVVQLAPGTIVTPAPVQIGTLPPIPSANGLYVVSGVRHVGDTRGRGDDWYTEITGVIMDFFANFLQARNAS